MESRQSYEQLLEKYGAHKYILYSELISCAEWWQKRSLIVNRDGMRCRFCNKVETDSVFIDSKLIHFYEEFEEADFYYGEYFLQTRVKSVMKKAKKPVYLHVHHTYYILSNKPWDYPDDALITLCSECHADFHQNNRVPIWFDDTRKVMANLTPCPRCQGAGHFPEYSHVQGGRCFDCNGAMYVELMR